MSDDGEAFERWGEGFNPSDVFADEAAKFMVPMFKAFVKNGLVPQEAAALTAAVVSQVMPMPNVEPRED